MEIKFYYKSMLADYEFNILVSIVIQECCICLFSDREISLYTSKKLLAGFILNNYLIFNSF